MLRNKSLQGEEYGEKPIIWNEKDRSYCYSHFMLEGVWARRSQTVCFSSHSRGVAELGRGLPAA